MPSGRTVFRRLLRLSCSFACAVAAGAFAVTMAAGDHFTIGDPPTISLTTIDGAPYTQNFDTLAVTGTSTSLPAGWALFETGTSAAADGSYTAGTGSGNGGDVYSFGQAGSTDRAFGTLLSGTLTPTIGASFTNNTGTTIHTLNITYTGEQWRLGQSGRGADRLDFQYSIDATSLTTGSWIDVDALDFNSPITTGTAGLLNGNAATNRTSIGGVITGVNIASGATFWIRWSDFNVTGSDDGLAVDDFSLTPSARVGPTGIGAASPDTVVVGQQTLLTIAVTPGVPPQGIAGVVANLTAIGGSAAQPLFDDGTNGDQVAGDLTYSFRAAANNIGTVSLPATITESGLNPRTGNATIALTVTAPPPPHHAIDEIQGSGDVSPLVGTMVETDGIVTARRSNGFFIQTPDANVDADPNTSEGVFVFTSSAPPAAAAIGAWINVVGKVEEFAGGSSGPNPLTSTEIDAPITVTTAVGGTFPLPAPVTITVADTDPGGPVDNLEKYEGMRVHVDSLTVVGPTDGNLSEANATATSNGEFYGVLTGVPRPFREPGVELPDLLPAGSPCCVPRFDTNPERIKVDSDGLGGAAIDVSTGAVVSNLTGPLDYTDRTYTILQDPPAVSPAPGVVPGMTAQAVRARQPHEFTIGTANLERFYDTINDPATSDVMLTATAFSNRLNKLSLQIRTIMGSPDIVGVEEMENLTTLQAAAAKINADAADPGINYVAYLAEGNDVGGIDVGFLVNSSRVVVTDVLQQDKDATFTDPTDGSSALVFDRPPLVLHATIVAPEDSPVAVTVIANHLRSLLSIDDPTDGPRVRAKRAAEAELTAQLIQSEQAIPGANVFAVGDFNADQFSDGYVDVINTIKGAPAPADQVVVATNDFVDPNLTDLVDLAAGADAPPHSYSFQGSAEAIDHVLVNTNALALYRAISWGRNNADFPEVARNDPNSPLRLSDHDPVVAYFALAATTTTTVTAMPNPVSFGQNVTFTAMVSAPDVPVTSGSVSFTDGAGFSQTTAVVNGLASATTASSVFGTVGSHTVTATFSGAPAYAGSSATVIEVVNRAPTMTTVTAGPNPSTFGAPVAFTATVAPAVATGTVTFTVDGAAFGPLVAIAGGVAVSASTSALVVGPHTVTAIYNGDVNFIGSAGSSTLTVGATLGAAHIRRGVTFNSGVTVSGSVETMLAGAIAFNGSATLTGDLFVAGTPTVVVNGHPHFLGTSDGAGSIAPSGYSVVINGNAALGHLFRRTDPVALPVVANPPAPVGTRSVALNSPSDHPGDFATIRDLTLNGNAGPVAVPPGTYGTFTANGTSAFVLGVAGSTMPTVYNLQTLNLNGRGALQVVGPVIVVVRNSVAVNGSVGAAGQAAWLTLRIAAGGLTLNSSASLDGYVEAPNGAVVINGNTSFTGGIAADSLTINSNGHVVLVPQPPQQ